ncbi:MAG: hypothetical protein J7J98_09680 [candidate division Zixibacteria bacterium]|nr:hypothetical protein [candidate division Zixibacteria bacterium]
MDVHCKQIFELRHKPDSTRLDFKGLWAKTISETLGFGDWNINDNEITVIAKEIR